jgi:zinc/manganese transport system substrate-binding protein
MRIDRPLSARARIRALAVAGALVTPLGRVAVTRGADQIPVVASFSVLADIVGQVGGDRVSVSSLVPVGGDAHTFDPAPKQVQAIAEADLIVQVGDDFEPWLNDLVDASGTSAKRYEAFGEAIAHDAETHGGTAEAAHDDHGDEEGHDDHGEIHVWLDVSNVIHTVEHLAETLTEIDPEGADTYAANAEAYTKDLETLDTYVRDETSKLPEKRRLLVTTHESFSAFAAAYDYEVAGVLLESHSTEGADAPAGHVADLVKIIDEHDIPAVFPDTPGGEEQLKPLAEAAGVEIAPSLYVDTLGDEGSGAETYIDMMRHNVDTIVAALGE